MNSKKFEYQHKDIVHLKRDIIFRSLFSILFLGIFIWQFVSIIIENINNELSFIQIVVSAIVLLSSLLLSLLSLMYIFKDFRIIAAIKMNGKCISSVQILFKTDKKSFIKLYNLLIQFLTLATALVLIASLTYSILQVTYMASISFYMPILMLICISGFNSIYHIRDEIKIQNSVQEYNALY